MSYNSQLQNNNIDLQNILDKVNALPNAGGGLDTSDATATAGDILADKTAYVDGEKVTGTIETKSESDVTVNDSEVIVPTGYYPTDVTVSVPSEEITLQAKTVSPSSSRQTVTADSGYDGLSSVTVNACSGLKYITNTYQNSVAGYAYAQVSDSDLVASNIKSGVSILGVTGTYTGETVSNTTCTVKITNNNMYTYYVHTVSNGKCSITSGSSSSATISNVQSGSVICFTYGYGGGSVTISGSASNICYGGGTGDSYAMIKISSSATGTITLTL